MPITNETTILVVDDEPTNLKLLKQVLSDSYRLIFAKSGEQAISVAKSRRPDLILLDVMMPQMNGFEVCEQLKKHQQTRTIPVIFVTAMQEDIDETRGFAIGAVDYITKPISPAVVKARIATHLSLVQAELLREAQVEVIQRLSWAAEYRDVETGQHIKRMSEYCYLIAKKMGFSEHWACTLRLAAPMHDIGKIGITDDVLLKPGKLDPDEAEHMKEHPLIGAKILDGSNSELLQLAHTLALEHHEKFDGSGYPHGKKGEEISIEGRICAVADVFDALTSARPYKAAWPVDKAISLLKEEKGAHFDPLCVDAFLSCLDDVLKVKEQHKDPEYQS